MSGAEVGGRTVRLPEHRVQRDPATGHVWTLLCWHPAGAGWVACKWRGPFLGWEEHMAVLREELVATFQACTLEE